MCKTEKEITAHGVRVAFISLCGPVCLSLDLCSLPVCMCVSRELEVGWLMSVCQFITYALKPTSNNALAHPRLRVIAILAAG